MFIQCKIELYFLVNQLLPKAKRTTNQPRQIRTGAPPLTSSNVKRVTRTHTLASILRFGVFPETANYAQLKLP